MLSLISDIFFAIATRVFNYVFMFIGWDVSGWLGKSPMHTWNGKKMCRSYLIWIVLNKHRKEEILQHVDMNRQVLILSLRRIIKQYKIFFPVATHGHLWWRISGRYCINSPKKIPYLYYTGLKYSPWFCIAILIFRFWTVGRRLNCLLTRLKICVLR